MTQERLLSEVIIHGLEPGTDLGKLAEEIEAAGFACESAGVEADVVLYGRTEPQIVSRDGRKIRPLKDFVAEVRAANIGGYIFLDIAERRATDALVRVLSKADCGLEFDSTFHASLGSAWGLYASDVTVGFQNPLQEHRREMWSREIRSSFIAGGYNETSFECWRGVSRVAALPPEPIADYRELLAEFAKGYERLIYMAPFEITRARYNQAECVEQDLEALIEEKLLEKVAVLGSVANVLHVRKLALAMLGIDDR